MPSKKCYVERKLDTVPRMHNTCVMQPLVPFHNIKTTCITLSDLPGAITHHMLSTTVSLLCLFYPPSIQSCYFAPLRCVVERIWIKGHGILRMAQVFALALILNNFSLTWHIFLLTYHKNIRQGVFFSNMTSFYVIFKTEFSEKSAENLNNSYSF